MFVYLIRSTTTQKTYVGSCKILARRLRQHNGEIKGGAKYTSSGRPWEFVQYVSGFKTWKECLSFEWNVKFQYNKKIKIRGIYYRRKAFMHTLIKFSFRHDNDDYVIHDLMPNTFHTPPPKSFYNSSNKNKKKMKYRKKYFAKKFYKKKKY